MVIQGHKVYAMINETGDDKKKHALVTGLLTLGQSYTLHRASSSVSVACWKRNLLIKTQKVTSIYCYHNICITVLKYHTSYIIILY